MDAFLFHQQTATSMPKWPVLFTPVQQRWCSAGSRSFQKAAKGPLHCPKYILILSILSVSTPLTEVDLFRSWYILDETKTPDKYTVGIKMYIYQNKYSFAKPQQIGNVFI